MYRYFNIVLILSILSSGTYAQSVHEALRSGDEAYDNAAYDQATQFYGLAAENDSPKGKYNLGNSLYQQEQYDKAVAQYESAINTQDEELNFRARHNLGNAHYQLQDYAQAAEQYKQALKLKPDDEETRTNLFRAQQRMKMQQQQQQQQNQNQDKQQENQENEEQQKNKNEQNSGDQKEQDQSQEGTDQNKEPQEGQNQNLLDKKELNKAEAEKLLEIAQQEEQKIQEKLKRNDAKPKSIEKDW